MPCFRVPRPSLGCHCSFWLSYSEIGVQIGVVTKASAAGLIAAGLLSVIIFPLLGLSLLRRQEQIESGTAPPSRRMPTPATPVISVEDRALCDLGKATVQPAG